MAPPFDGLQAVVDTLYRKGAECDFGIDESHLPAMIEKAFARYPTKGVCAIKDWMWWDYDVSEKVQCSEMDASVQPAIVFAAYLIWDSRDRWPEGWNVKTSALVAFEENCFFITRSTVYILVGRGYRKTVDPQVAASLHF